MGTNSEEHIKQNEKLYTINTTFKIKGSEVVSMENSLIRLTQMVDYKVIPDTSKLYENDHTFKKMVKSIKKAQRERDIYINNNN